jgi:indole-3-glycerol phosphate synthase
MQRYCMEFDRKTSPVVHLQTCDSYIHASLLSVGRIVDIGGFKGSSEALNSVAVEFPEAVLCKHCVLDSKRIRGRETRFPVADMKGEGQF